jgi:hypothetical protein
VDSFATALRGRSEFHDLVAVAILKDDAKDRAAKMIAACPTPVLLDTPEENFKGTFGVSGARSFFVFDRQGCLIEWDIAVTPDQPGQLDQLVDPLHRAAG